MFRFGEGVTNGQHYHNNHRCGGGRGYRFKCRCHRWGCLREETSKVSTHGCFVREICGAYKTRCNISHKATLCIHTESIFNMEYLDFAF